PRTPAPTPALGGIRCHAAPRGVGAAERWNVARGSCPPAPPTISPSFTIAGPRQSEKPGRADASGCGPTSLPGQEGRGRAERCGPRAAHAPLTGSPRSGIQLPDSPLRRECACAVSGSLHLRFPSPCPPSGAPGPAGPCSPAPAPAGFIWRLICGRIICLDLKDTFCSSLLIYNFRIFERRYGSRKFASFLLGSWVLSALVDLILVEAMWYFFGIATAGNLPSGFLAPVFALFVPFYCSIPRIQVAQILGPLSITNKTLIYILGLQISGICYNSKVFQLQQVLCIPRWMAKFFSWTLEPIFSSPEPTTEARIGMGATVDIQRQQRMELLDRQLMLSQFAQVRRQRQQGGMINWNRLFPPLRQRRNINYQDGRQSEQQASPPLEVSEEQVSSNTGASPKPVFRRLEAVLVNQT
uniref:UBA domain containing 2 n=1 Tax=Canis lupus familiaris TaxID=9615 RepID=A0A8P0PB90_CANLF